MRLKVATIACLSVCGLSAEAQAQSTPQPASSGASSDSYGLSEIVVTAQKREEKLQNVPISIAVVSGKALDSSTFTGVNEVLNTVPGISTSPSPQGSGSLIQIRGAGANGPTYDGPSTVGFYIDSVPFGLIRSALLPNSPTFDLQRVEVLKGPQGTLYGANAENGVVRILTNDADLNAFGASVRTMASSTENGGGNYGGDVAVNIPLIEGKLAIRAVVDYQDMSGWINSPVGNHNNDSELRSYRLKVNAQPTEQLSIALSAWAVRNDFGGPNQSNAERRVDSEIAEPSSTDWNAYAFKVGYDFGYFSVTNTASLFNIQDVSVFDLGKLPTGAPLGIPFLNVFDSSVFSDELLLNSSPQSDWKWTAGAFFRNDTDRGFANIPGFSPEPTFNQDNSKSYAFFGQVGHRFLQDQFEWTLGVRYFNDKVISKDLTPGGFPPLADNHLGTSSFHPVTPRAVLTWYPSKDLTAYVSYSEGVRSGLPQDGTVLTAVPTFPPVKPDKLHNYEIGAKADLMDGLVSLDTALYYIKWKDVQQAILVPFGAMPVAALVNGPSASGVGVDFGATVRPLQGLEFSVSAGWNDLTMDRDVPGEFNAGPGGALLFKKGDRLDYSPKFQGSLSTAYNFPLVAGYTGKFAASDTYSSKQSDFFIFGGVAGVNTGNSTTNLRTTLSVVTPFRLTAALFADNLTNNYGALPSEAFPDPRGQLGYRPRPRTVGIQLDYKY